MTQQPPGRICMYKTTTMVAGAAAALVLNQLVMEALLIPDPCRYHGEQPGWFIGVLYSFPAFAGGHPVPSIVNLLATALAGAWVGVKLGNRVPKWVAKFIKL